MSVVRSWLKRRFPRLTRKLADRWRWHFRLRNDFGRELRYRQAIDIAELTQKDRVLEVGQCTYQTLRIAGKVQEVVVCDLAEPSPAVAAHGPRNLRQVQADIKDAALAPGYFDVAFAVAVLEHIEDDSMAVANLHRILRPGGRLVVYVPDTAEHRAAWARGEYPDHVRPGYTPGEMTELLSRGGFEVEECRLVHGAHSAVAADLYYGLVRKMPFLPRLPRFVIRPFLWSAARDDRRGGSLRWGLYAKAAKKGADARLSAT